MQNENKALHTGFGVLALILSFMTYLLTVQPTVPMWDCGEFTAAAVQQQVPHPPGAPLFLMIGKVFHLIPFGDDGLRVNLVSVVSSAVCILLLYLISVRVIRNFFKEDLGNVSNALAVYGASFVGAMAFAFSDTLWFNAVESEVYAASQLFVSLIVWLMMVWNDKADSPGHERYLLLITYLIGLSIGVHLLSILTLFSLVLLVYLRKFRFSIWGLLGTMVAGVVLFGVIYSGIIMKYPSLLAGNLPFKTEAGEWLVEDNGLLTIIAVGILAIAAYGVYHGRKKAQPILALACSSFLLLMIGYSTYTHILVRANSNPPMNENKPETLDKLVAYLGREQYGEAPSWPRRYQDDQRFRARYEEMGPWSPMPTKVVTKRDGKQFVKRDFAAAKPNTSAELRYLWEYQIKHMYLRYFAWNFVGRVSDVQDAGALSFSHTLKQDGKQVDIENYRNGYADLFPINFFALPLILGLFGFVVHVRRDPKMASVYLVLFLMTGVLAAIQQNQQDPQPRERDYFYTASFMTFCLWISVGAFGVVDMLRKNAAVTGMAVAGLLLAVPVNMAAQGWRIHSRAGNYLAFDYAYNILQSTEKDAIIFTNGDNDTFPVWYLQDVAGVRRDVRIVNLSLGQTGWYMEQLKNRSPHGALKIPLSFSDESLLVSEDDPRAVGPDFNEPAKRIRIPVDRAIMAQFTNDSALLANPVMEWTYVGVRAGGEGAAARYHYYPQHKLVRDIMVQTAFKRPVYFSMSVGDPRRMDEYVGLSDYMRLEGLCYRVCPVPIGTGANPGYNEAVMDASLLKTRNGDDYSLTPAYGLKFRNLNNPDVYYDDIHRSYITNYRNAFYIYANYLLRRERNLEKAGRVLLTMNELISPALFPMRVEEEEEYLRMLQEAGNRKGTEQMAKLVLASTKTMIDNPAILEGQRAYNPSYDPWSSAAEAYTALRQYKEAERMYDAAPVPPVQKQFMKDMLAITVKIDANDDMGALQLAKSMVPRYPLDSPDRMMAAMSNSLHRQIAMLESKLNLPKESRSIVTVVP